MIIFLVIGMLKEHEIFYKTLEDNCRTWHGKHTAQEYGVGEVEIQQTPHAETGEGHAGNDYKSREYGRYTRIYQFLETELQAKGEHKHYDAEFGPYLYILQACYGRQIFEPWTG